MRNVRHIALTSLAGAFLLTGAPSAFAQERFETAQLDVEDRGYDRATVPAGTDIPVTVDEDITVKADELGKTFEAHVTRDVTVDGEVVIPEGAPARVKLIRSEEDAEHATLRLAEVRVDGEMRSVRTADAEADTERDKAGAGKKTGIGAAAGAIVGAVTGAGVVKGALIGAGGGLAWGLLSGREHEVGKGTQLGFELTRSVSTR